MRSWDLAAFGTIKHPPYRGVLGNILELMLGSRSHEQEIARLKRVPPPIVQKHSPAANDEVDLILCVWRLRARAHRKGKCHIQGATPKGNDCMLRRKDFFPGLGNTKNTATICFAHSLATDRRLW
jgi:hypothetical protein